jgi:hypothetical protein
MDHKEKAATKWAAYKNGGWNVTDVVSTEDNSVFFSEKDNVYRKHEFTFNDAVVTLSAPINFKVPVVIIAEVEPEPIVVVQQPVTKVSKKKGAK